jgi:uroporphyrinogen decarboxylase
MQSSRELVQRAIEFKGPERVPYNFDENRTPPIVTKYGDDFIWVFVDPASGFTSAQPGMDEWGIISETLDEKVFGLPKVHPLADLTHLDQYPFPDFTQSQRYHTMGQRIAMNPDKYILGMFPHFLFQHMISLIGFEQFMIAIMEDREKINLLVERLTLSCLSVVEYMAERGVNGMIAIEDLGLQDRLMISPRLWREVYKSSYKRIIQSAHARGMHIFLHSCGYTLDVIEDLITIGLDVIQIDQQDNMGIDELARRYAGRICFFCPVDIQTTLSVPENYKTIEHKTRRLMEAFGSQNGGFIAKTYPQPEAIHIPEENTACMCKTVRQFGKYPLNKQN